MRACVCVERGGRRRKVVQQKRRARPAAKRGRATAATTTYSCARAATAATRARGAGGLAPQRRARRSRADLRPPLSSQLLRGQRADAQRALTGCSMNCRPDELALTSAPAMAAPSATYKLARRFCCQRARSACALGGRRARGASKQRESRARAIEAKAARRRRSSGQRAVGARDPATEFGAMNWRWVRAS